jgi:hypothetical protein
MKMGLLSLLCATLLVIADIYAEQMAPVLPTAAQTVAPAHTALSQPKEQAAEKKGDELPQLPPPPTLKTVIVPPYRGPLAGSSEKEIVEYLMPLIRFHDIDNMISLLKGVQADTKLAVVTTIVQRKDFPLKPEEKAQFIIGVVGTHFVARNNEPMQQKLFNLLATIPSLHGKIPFSLIATRYPAAAEPLVAWAESYVKKNKKAAAWLGEMDFKLAQAVVAQNDPQKLKALLAHLSLKDESTTKDKWPTKATRLLVQAAGIEHANPAFISILLKKGADLNAGFGGYTPLMKATAMGNRAFVRALIKAGANLNVVLDPAIGTALQLAIEKKQIAIEEDLRAHGATD